ncbi:hypothetical protein ASH02_05495 [Nocardioides sp. Soil796]|nr:hypothetical protein ASH02_05495 [Nocardioides sp. Soil796]
MVPSDDASTFTGEVTSTWTWLPSSWMSPTVASTVEVTSEAPSASVSVSAVVERTLDAPTFTRLPSPATPRTVSEARSVFASETTRWAPDAGGHVFAST